MSFRLFYLFDDHRLNFLVYFTISTLVLALGPEFFMPNSFSKTRNVPIVQAPAGDVSGIEITTRDGRVIYGYLGIPFAQPPIGSLRFLRPQPFDERASKIHDGSSYANKCIHPFKLGGFVLKVGSEDCLAINVHTPKSGLEKPKGLVKDLLPVMVYVHGGGFVTGDATDLLYGAKFLMDRDVVLVTFQYRLGSLGFFSMDTDMVGGNQGMWDQREALLWVQKNIESFGGDPNQVTLFGESAGGMSVAAHLMSEQSKGLFHKAIIQSGPIHTNFMMVDRDFPLSKLHLQYAESLGCPTNSRNSEETLQCLQSLPAESFVDNLAMFDECPLGIDLFAFPAIWKPQVDFAHSSKPFFSSDYVTAVSKGKFASDVPVMIGFNREDGLITTGHMSKKPELVERLRNDWDQCLSYNMFGRQSDDHSDTHKKLSKRIADMYLKDGVGQKLNFTKDFLDITNMFTDSTFGQGSSVLVKSFLASQKSPIYFYRFDHLGAFSGGDIFSSELFELLQILAYRALGLDATKGLGVSHLDEVFYVLSSKFPLLGPEDLSMSKAMVDMWVNFAKQSNPTPKDGSAFVGEGLQQLQNGWPKAGTKGRKCDYIRLEKGQISLECDEEMDKRFEMWAQIMKELKL